MLKRGQGIFPRFKKIKKFTKFNKKAVEMSLWTLIEITLVVLVSYAMFSFVGDVAESKFFERSALSKDLALLMDTVQSIPGDLYYSYEHGGIDMKEYSFTFSKNEMIVQDSRSSLNPDVEGSGILKNYYPYYDTTVLFKSYFDHGSTNANSQGKIIEKDKIEFMKTSDSLTIAESVNKEFGKRSCIVNNANQKEIKLVYIIYSDSLNQDAQNLKTILGLAQIVSSVHSVENAKSDLKDGRYETSADLIIKLSRSNENYISYRDSNFLNLACMISNNLLTTLNKNEKQIEDIIIILDKNVEINEISNVIKKYNEDYNNQIN